MRRLLPPPIALGLLLAELFDWSQSEPETLPNGWTLFLDCGVPPTMGPFGVNLTTCGIKTINLSSLGEMAGLNFVGSTRAVGFIGDPHAPLPPNYTSEQGPLSQIWRRVQTEVPWAQPLPELFQTPLVPFVLPPRWPGVDPFWPPEITQPEPQPVPWHIVPYRRPNPDRSPDEQPQRGPEPTPSPARSPRPRPYQLPSFDIELQPGPKPDDKPKPVTRPAPGRHNQLPPKGKQRERKVIMGINGASLLGRIIGAITEGADFIDVLFDSLTEEAQRGHWKDNPFEKLGHVLDNLDKVRFGTLLAGLLSEWAEDQAFGRMSQLQAAALREAWERGMDVVPRPELGPGDSPPNPGVKRDQPWVDALDQWLAENVYEPALGL